MASEFVLGMHGRLEFDGVRLAGLWPHDQLRVVEQAGATIFGPCVNVNTDALRGLERGARGHDPQAVRGRGDASPCTSTPGWGSAACP